MFGAADLVWQTNGVVSFPLDDLARERDIRAVQAQDDQQAFADAWAHGRSMTNREVIAYTFGGT